MSEHPKKIYKTRIGKKPLTGRPFPFEHPSFQEKEMEELIRTLKVLTMKKQKYVTLVLPIEVGWASLFGECIKKTYLNGATKNSKMGWAAAKYTVRTIYNRLFNAGYIEQPLREFYYESQGAIREVNEMFNMFDLEEQNETNT